jgi:hypothetical protein
MKTAAAASTSGSNAGTGNPGTGNAARSGGGAGGGGRMRGGGGGGGGGNNEEAKALEERKLELLALARRSRVKWITDAADKPNSGSSDPHQSKSGDAVTKPAGAGTPTNANKRRDKFPAAECIQNVLEVLSEIVDDGEVIDIDAVISLIPTDKDIDELQSAEVPQYDGPDGPKNHYTVFIEKLRHFGAVEIVKSMQYFVMKFEQTIRNYQLEMMTEDPQLLSKSAVAALDDGEDLSRDRLEDPVTAKRVASVWEFLEKTYNAMHSSYLWASETDAQWEKTKAACEKFLFIKLYHLIFACDVEDSHLDKKLADRVASLSFLTGEHLDIRYLRPGDNSLLMGPVNMLRRLASARSPADKLSVLKKTSLAIAEALKKARTDGSLPGADEFLPMMILAVKECNPPQISSTVKFLQRYTEPRKLVSEAGYLLTHFVSAVQFLEHVDARALTISPEEFERSMARSIAAAKRANDQLVAKHNTILASRTGAARVDTSANRSRTRTDSNSSINSENDYDDMDIRWQYYGPSASHMPVAEADDNDAEMNATIGISGVRSLPNESDKDTEQAKHKKEKEADKERETANAAEKAKYDKVLTDLITVEKKGVPPAASINVAPATPSRSLAYNGILDQVLASSNHRLLQDVPLDDNTRRAIAQAAATSHGTNSRNSNSLERDYASLLSGRFGTATADTLTFSDVNALLAEYKILLRAATVLSQPQRR